MCQNLYCTANRKKGKGGFLYQTAKHILFSNLGWSLLKDILKSENFDRTTALFGSEF
jgi:hypothetical protein